MLFTEYTQYDAIGLAELVQSRQVSPKNLLMTALHRANKLNPSLNAIINRFDEKAINNLKDLKLDSVFAGVPFLFKDLGFQLAGQPLTMGSRSLCIDASVSKDNELVRRMHHTGIIPFGQTNTSELGLNITTEPKAYGMTHNPFKLGYSAGGFSGGSACAISAGIVPMASSCDGGGAIRLPAAWCGVFGLKPSRGRNPLDNTMGEWWNGAVQNHVTTRSVRDSALMLDMTCGSELGSPYFNGNYLDNYFKVENSFLYATYQPSKKLRIALHTKPLIADTDIHEDVVKALKQTAKQLESMGHTVELADPDFDIERVSLDFLTVVCSYTAFEVDQVARLYGRDTIRQLEPSTRNIASVGRSLTAQDLLKAQQGWHDLKRQTDRLLQTYDVILCPTVPTPAEKHDVLTPSKNDELLMNIGSYLPFGRYALHSGLAEKIGKSTLSKMAFTILGNMTGLPCMSVPMATSTDGLPIGMQFIASMNDESTLFSLAGDIEDAGWFTQPAFEVYQ